MEVSAKGRRHIIESVTKRDIYLRSSDSLREEELLYNQRTNWGKRFIIIIKLIQLIKKLKNSAMEKEGV